VSPLLGFTKLKDKLLDGSKTQTIRKPRKHPVQVGDKLFIYWMLRTEQCEKLGEAVVTKIEQKPLYRMNKEDAIKDGFNSIEELNDAFFQMHRKLSPMMQLDIITFRWTQKLWEDSA